MTLSASDKLWPRVIVGVLVVVNNSRESVFDMIIKLGRICAVKLTEGYVSDEMTSSTCVSHRDLVCNLTAGKWCLNSHSTRLSQP